LLPVCRRLCSAEGSAPCPFCVLVYICVLVYNRYLTVNDCLWCNTSMTTPRYKSNAGVVFNLNYHIVFCPKYRRSVLVGDIETRLKELLHEKANALGVEVAMLEVMPDHVHLFITAPPLSPRRLYHRAAFITAPPLSPRRLYHRAAFITAPPNDAPQHYVNQFKGYTSRVLRQEFPELKRKLPSLWSRSYYIGAAGAVTEDVIHRYIENQKGK
jgi:putative transposase